MSNLLVTISTIKSNSFIEQNVDAGKLRQSALEAQRVDVRGILGASLTDFFLGRIATATGAPTGLTSVQQEFYDSYVIPMMASATEGQFIYAGHYQITNTGVNTVKGTNTDPASEAAVTAAFKRAMNRFDYYATRAKQYIIDSVDPTDLRDYYYANNQNLTPQRKTTQGFIYTPNRNNDGCCDNTLG